ncbi:MAG TPA: UDP-glucose/GDP-mannose dehydrogenase family protein [Candidatus Saccharimonadales bacterium]|nr:UDP-glucose/GDP-mannose dehydrogenase family protein [Candidatus Saccharimonadales bacterium]
MKKIAIVGTGYVGLVTGTCFAELGNDVTCVDIDSVKVQRMKAGQVPIYEPGLEDLFTRNIAAERLRFTTDLADAVSDAEVIFLALPTPPGEDGSADLSYVLGVADDLGPLLKQYAVVVDKSTVPVGTAEKVRERISKKAAVAFDVVSNPEFLREGVAVDDFMKPDRVVIGAGSKRAAQVMTELYEPITDEEHPLLLMNERSAEVTKYAANSFLATKITFINQIANLCERVGADVESVRMGVGSDPRIGYKFLYPGIGYGGSCFPKDVLALIHTADEYDYQLELLQTVVAHNRDQPEVFIEKIKRYFGGDVAGKKFALWGLAFKPDTDDIREAPAILIIEALTAAGAQIVAYDPEATANMQRRFADNDQLRFANDEFEALDGADALIIATEWKQFAGVSFDQIKARLAQPVVFDGRNLFELESAKQAGVYYESVGRPVVKP